jgi:hypothetical protein
MSVYEDTNPVTGVSPKDDRFVVFDPATNKIVNFNSTWTRLDGGPHEGPFPGGRRYFKKMRPDDMPVADFDHRYSVNTTTVMQDMTPYITGHPHGDYVTVITGTLRTATELKEQVDAQWTMADRTLYSEGNEPMASFAVTMAQGRRASGIATANDLAVIAEAEAIYDKMTQNRDRRNTLHEDIDAGEEYDLSVGWQNGTAAQV